MEKKINAITWTLSAIALLLLVMAVYVPTGHTVAIIVVAVISLVSAGVVYYGGHLLMDIRDKKKEQKLK